MRKKLSLKHCSNYLLSACNEYMLVHYIMTIKVMEDYTMLYSEGRLNLFS